MLPSSRCSPFQMSLNQKWFCLDPQEQRHSILFTQGQGQTTLCVYSSAHCSLFTFNSPQFPQIFQSFRMWGTLQSWTAWMGACPSVHPALPSLCHCQIWKSSCPIRAQASASIFAFPKWTPNDLSITDNQDASLWPYGWCFPDVVSAIGLENEFFKRKKEIILTSINGTGWECYVGLLCLLSLQRQSTKYIYQKSTNGMDCTTGSQEDLPPVCHSAYFRIAAVRPLCPWSCCDPTSQSHT